MSKFHNRYTDEELIQAIKDFYNETGRVPNISDFKGKAPNPSTFRRLGSWKEALALAGLKKEKDKSSDYTKEYLFNCLLEYYDKYNKIPTIRGIKSKGYPTAHAFINHFGSFKNALIETGLFELRQDKHQFCKEYTDDELLDLLRDYMRDKDRIPTHAYMRDTLSPSTSTYERRFENGVFGALKLIGYDIDKQNEEDLIAFENEMIEKYKNLKEILGKVPSSRDIESYSRKYGLCPAMKTYEHHFGSLYELQLLCGFTPTVIGRNKSRDDMIDDLIWLSNELGRTPSQNDLIYFDHVASTKKYADEFGSWNNAVVESGLKPNSGVYYSNNGVECLSYYELIFTNMLEEYNIDFLKEEYYKNYMETERRYRFDYIISYNNIRYFIEIFGIVCRDDYKERTKNKLKLCKENNLNLIEIYPEDFTSYKSEDIHTMLQEKISNKLVHN